MTTKLSWWELINSLELEESNQGQRLLFKSIIITLKWSLQWNEKNLGIVLLWMHFQHRCSHWTVYPVMVHVSAVGKVRCEMSINSFSMIIFFFLKLAFLWIKWDAIHSSLPNLIWSKFNWCNFQHLFIKSIKTNLKTMHDCDSFERESLKSAFT